MVTAEASREQGERKMHERRLERARGSGCVCAHKGAVCHQRGLGRPVIHAAPSEVWR